jgi:anti-sigma-K factor RskA
MTEDDPMSEKRDCGGDAAAYVLGALEAEEADAFRRHLQTCVVCRDEVSEFTAVVDVLPLAAPPQRLPRSLKRRVMADVRGEPRRSRSRRTGPRTFGWLAGISRPVLGAAATVGVVVVAATAVLIGSGASGTRLIPATVSSRSATAVLRLSGGRGELILHGMPAPPAGQVYEVWIKRPAQPPAPTSALFEVTSSGAGTVGVPGDLRGVSQVMVTAEPAGGTKVPTHPPVIVANLT